MERVACSTKQCSTTRQRRQYDFGSEPTSSEPIFHAKPHSHSSRAVVTSPTSTVDLLRCGSSRCYGFLGSSYTICVFTVHVRDGLNFVHHTAVATPCARGASIISTARGEARVSAEHDRTYLAYYHRFGLCAAPGVGLPHKRSSCLFPEPTAPAADCLSHSLHSRSCAKDHQWPHEQTSCFCGRDTRADTGCADEAGHGLLVYVPYVREAENGG